MTLNKLLLADDSLTIQKVVELVLAHENFEIKAVNDGEQAIEALDSFAPDIVLADIEMPKLNGYQLCEKVKGNMSTVHIPVILLAGAFEPFDEEYAKAVGADDYIIKPFESQELISKVKALLASAKPPKEAAPQEELEEEPVMSEEAMEMAEAKIETVSPPVEEPKWDEEIPVITEEKTEYQEIIDEEYEAKVALSSTGKGFEEELTEALKEEKAPVQVEAVTPSLELPSKEDISEIVKQAVDKSVSEIINSDVAAYLSSAIKDSVVQTVSDIAPGIIEDVTRELTKELLGSLRDEINAAIVRIVPEVAGAIIKKEIEKITSEI